MVRFVVDRIEEKTAILITDDDYIVEFPVDLLPDGVKESNVLDFNITPNPEDEAKRKERVRKLQEELLKRTEERKKGEPT